MYRDSSTRSSGPPDDVERFVDELLAIDGRSPALGSHEDRRPKDRHRLGFDTSGGGAKSGLPSKELF
jgi:hypothetical protein